MNGIKQLSSVANNCVLSSPICRVELVAEGPPSESSQSRTRIADALVLHIFAGESEN